MELKPRSYEKIGQVINKGVAMPNPLTVDIGDEVAVDRISGNRVTIYPGCRIYGAKTAISPGVRRWPATSYPVVTVLLIDDPPASRLPDAGQS